MDAACVLEKKVGDETHASFQERWGRRKFRKYPNIQACTSAQADTNLKIETAKQFLTLQIMDLYLRLCSKLANNHHF
jgi:hypothetical protein